MTVSVRRAVPSDADALFELAVAFATSFAPERGAFEASLGQVLADESTWLGVGV